MLSVYSRHYPPCTSDDINYKRCRCPKWINGVLGSDGPFLRRSAKTRSWEKAEESKRELEADYAATQNVEGEAIANVPEKVTVRDAVGRFLKSKRNENLADSTIDKLKTIFEKQLLSWASESRLIHLEEITTADLEAFRDTWEDGPLAKKKKQERLIGFFYYCLRLGWIKTNPAVSLGRVRADGPPTDYFPKNEFEQIIDATYIYQPKGWVECRNQATRLRILTLLMRWSGLAIRDAVTLERRRLNDKDELFLYRRRLEILFMCRFLRALRSRYGRFRQGRLPIRGIFSGLAMVRPSQWLATGSEVFAASSRSPTFGEKMEPQSAAIRTCSATHSRLRCCLRVCLSNRSQFCLATKA